jgi:hypothetical protein
VHGLPISFFQKPAVISFYYFPHDARRVPTGYHEKKKILNKTAAGIWARAQLYLAGRYSSKAPAPPTLHIMALPPYGKFKPATVKAKQEKIP